MQSVIRLAVTLLLLSMGLALAQADPDVARLQLAVEEARESASITHPDQPEWRAAIRLADSLVTEQPESPELALLRAQIYSEVAWYARAYQAWLDYAATSGLAPDASAFSEAALQLGFARWRAQDYQGASSYYSSLLEWQPDNAEALYWLGRVQLEQGEDELAAATFGRLLDLDYAEELPAGQLRLARHVGQYGPLAALAFDRGIVLADAGQAALALAEFEAAFTAARDFTEAAVWAGRMALELQDPALAVVYWGWVVELDPADERSRYFLQLAQRQEAYGVAAVSAFDAGQSSYSAGDLEEALASFEEANRLSPGYLDALSWSARVAQELGRHELAADYWQRVLSLNPDDEGARYFLRLAQQRLAFGTDVSDEFLQGVIHYQAAEFQEAEAAFRRVTAEDPDFAPAWGYIGQINFAQRDFETAADAFERARSLEPGNDEYTFFAMEARRLAGSQD